MWTDSRYSVPVENSFVMLGENETGRDGFTMVQSKRRKRNDTEQSSNRSVFMNCSTDDKLNMIFDELKYIRGCQEQTNRGMISFQNGFRGISEKLTQVVNITNKNTSLMKTLAYKSIDIEARSRRNNLIFWGIHESYNENCFALIRDFIDNHLDLDPNGMYLSRAHRLGPRKIGHQNPKRPIIVNFRDFCDTEEVMGRAHMLKHTPFSIGYDLPKEIKDARKKLWDELKLAKSRQPRAKCQILYPAKLVVDGKVVRDEFPDWTEVMKSSRLADFSHIDNNFHFDQPSFEPSVAPQQTGSNACASTSRDHVLINSVPMNEMVLNENVPSGDCDMDQSVCSGGSDNAIGLPQVQPANNRQNCEQQKQQLTSVEGPLLLDFEQVPPLSTSTVCNRENESRSSSPIVSTEKNDRPLLQPAIFRPYDNCSGKSLSSISKHDNDRNEQVSLPVEMSLEKRCQKERISRPLQRGYRRVQSLSVPRTNQITSRDKTENPNSIAANNRNTGENDSSQSKQTCNNSTITRESSHREPKNSDTCESRQGNTHRS